MTIIRILGFIPLIAFTAHAGAADFEASTMRLCKKMEACTLQQMGDVDSLSPEMKEMIINSVSGLCSAMQTQFQAADMADHELSDSAAACMDSMAQRSCAELMEGNEPETEECLAYQEKAESYSQ